MAFLIVAIVGNIAQAKGRDGKIQICHATASIGKPYNKINVSHDAVDEQKEGNHSSHAGAVFSRDTIHQYFDWGDIIPSVENVTAGLNWDAAGQAIWNNDCLVTPSPPTPSSSITPTSTPTPTPTPSPTPTPQARLVINEVYYDVDSAHGGDGNVTGSGEWVELYNAGGAAISIQDWIITDNMTARTISTSHTIAAFSYALIAKDSSIFNYWSVPSGTEIISISAGIGNGLGNSGDLLILKDQFGNIIDQISWGNNISILNPAIIGVAEGHSIERDPAGFDTDWYTDFVDRLTPTPGS